MSNNDVDVSVIIRVKIYIILMLISLLLFSYSIWQIKPIDVDVTDYLGLASKLTLTYWIGLSLVVLCSILLYYDANIIDTDNDLIYLIVAIVFALFIFATPIFAESNARLTYSYYPAGEIKTVLNESFVDTFKSYNLMSYRTWPSLHLITAGIIFISGVEFEDVIKYIPLFWILTFVIVSFSVGRTLFTPNKAMLLSLLGVASFWIPQYYYSGQSFGYIAIILIFWMFLRNIDMQKKEELILLVIFFSMLVMTHFLTSALIVAIMVLTFIYIKLKRYLNGIRKSVSGRHNIRENVTLDSISIIDKISDESENVTSDRIYLFAKMVSLFGIIFVAWHAYLAPYAFRYGLNSLYRQITVANPLYFQDTVKFVSTSPIKESINNFRLTYLLIYAIIFVIVIFQYMKYKNLRNDKVNMTLCWLFGAALFLPLKYGVEIYERIFMFSIMPLMVLAILTLGNNKFGNKILLLLLISLTILHIPAHYGSESYDLTRDTELKGTEFFSLRMAPDDIYFYFFWNYIAYHNNDLVKLKKAAWGPSHYPNITIIDNVKYILNSKTYDNMMKYYQNYNPIYDVYDKINYNNVLIYDNGAFEIFVRRNT